MMKKVVIIGGVAGGASCAARLRRLDESMDIVLLERGEYVSYANCGLPYHVGGVIPDRAALMLETPERMHKRFGIDVRVRNEAVRIDRDRKVVMVRSTSGEEYEEPYDALVIASGSSPLRPGIPGIDSSRIVTLWTVPDADRLRGMILEGRAKSVAIVGGGFIGLEMAENLHAAGLEVSLIEALDQVMAPLDYEMARVLHGELQRNGVSLHLGDGVQSFREEDDGVEVTLASGAKAKADLAVLSIGVRPNGALAKEAGLEMNPRGGIVTDARMRTSDPNIYAVGDVAEVEDFVFGGRTMVPLAGPANRQGRVAADNIVGMDSVYEGTQGTFVAQVFGLTAAATGMNERTLIARGMVRGKDYESVILSQHSHAKYYPGHSMLFLKLLFSMDGRKIYGAQTVGKTGADKRIDVIATVVRLGGGIEDLKRLELAYAPPYSSPKDIVNMAGFAAGNVLSGLAAFSEWDSVEKSRGATLLDVREDWEREATPVPGVVEIVLGSLRDRMGELDPDKEIIIFCAIGARAHTAARTLAQHGFRNAKIYPGGVSFYKATHCPAP